MYTVMYFGLTNALTYFMDLVNKVFMEYLDKLIIAFINGIMVCPKSDEEHEEHFCLILQKLRDPRLYAKLSMCEFCHFRKRNICVSKQDLRCAKLEGPC
jgi:hypothetical protein